MAASRAISLILVNFESVPLSLHASISVNLQSIKPPVGRAFKNILSAHTASVGGLIGCKLTEIEAGLR